MSKIMSLIDAVGMIKDGDRIAVGGFAVYQHPMAFVREIIRQKKKNLTVVGTANGIEVDLLIGAGCISRLETSYVGLESRGLALNFRRAVESCNLQIVDYPEILAFDRFRASQENLPFWPCTYLGGNDILRVNKDIKEFKCPLTNELIYAVPPASPRVGIIHAIAADEDGNVLIQKHHLVPQTLDVLLARSCEVLIVTVEKIVSKDVIKKNYQLNEIPSYKTKAVVEVPWGCHPTPLLGSYIEDGAHLDEYVQASKTSQNFNEYLEKYIFKYSNHEEYLEYFGVNYLAKLKEVDAI
jgi:glutaconate CoA-transferase subunit A